MKLALILAALLVADVRPRESDSRPSPVRDKYSVQAFHCYMAHLYAIVDDEGKIVSDPYGAGAAVDLKQLAKAWSRDGIDKQEERKMVESLKKRKWGER